MGWISYNLVGLSQLILQVISGQVSSKNGSKHQLIFLVCSVVRILAMPSQSATLFSPGRVKTSEKVSFLFSPLYFYHPYMQNNPNEPNNANYVPKQSDDDG